MNRMTVAFYIVDCCSVQAVHSALCQKCQIECFPFLQLQLGFSNLLRKRKVRYWFQYVIQCAYLISLNGILCRVGNKDNQHFFIELANPSGCLHSVELRHLDIHQQNIINRAVVFGELYSIGKLLNLKLCLILPGITLKIIYQLAASGFIVFNDCNTHSFPLLHRAFFLLKSYLAKKRAGVNDSCIMCCLQFVSCHVSAGARGNSI